MVPRSSVHNAVDPSTSVKRKATMQVGELVRNLEGTLSLRRCAPLGSPSSGWTRVHEFERTGARDVSVDFDLVPE
jgi:hypothetical protein